MLSKDAKFFVKFLFSSCRSNPPEVFLGTGVIKICSKFTGEHPCGSAISIKLLFALRHGCSPVNLKNYGRFFASSD